MLPIITHYYTFDTSTTSFCYGHTEKNYCDFTKILAGRIRTFILQWTTRLKKLIFWTLLSDLKITHSKLHYIETHPFPNLFTPHQLPSPTHFASIVFSQALCYKRICSNEKELNLQLTTLKNAFSALGYRRKTVKNQITKAMSIPQEALLKYQTKSKSNRIPPVLIYYPYLRPINKITKI